MEYGGITDGELAQIQAQRFNEARPPASRDSGRIALLQRQVAILEKQVQELQARTAWLATHRHGLINKYFTGRPQG